MLYAFLHLLPQPLWSEDFQAVLLLNDVLFGSKEMTVILTGSKIDYIFVTPNVKDKSTSICGPNEEAMASGHCFFLANMQF